MVDKLIDCALHIVLGWYIDFLPGTFLIRDLMKGKS